MNVDIDLLQDLLNDTTDGEWKSIDTKLLILTLSGDYDIYDIQSCGDAAFIAYVKNHAQEIIDALNDRQNEADSEEFIRTLDGANLDEILEKLDKLDGFGGDE